MAKYIDVELATGGKVRVYPAPSPQLGQIIDKKFPDPQPPIRESKTVTGEIIKMSIDDDPEYLREKERVERLKAEEMGSLTMLFALKDVTVPSDFSTDSIVEIVHLSDPEWKPREGEAGRKLDYLEWVLLTSIVDRIKIQEALAELSGIDLDAVKAIEKSFQNNMERKKS